jgi:hypothetical protein
MKLCSEEELDFLLLVKNQYGHNSLHYSAHWRDSPFISSLVRAVRERGWRGEREQEEWRNSLDEAGMTALHLAIAFPGYSGADAPEAVRALLCPLEEEGGDEAVAKEQEGRGEETEQQDDDQETTRRKERSYLCGVDPNKKCTKRTGACRLLGPEDDEDT